MWNWQEFLDKNYCTNLPPAVSPCLHFACPCSGFSKSADRREVSQASKQQRVDGVGVGFGNVVQHQNKKL